METEENIALTFPSYTWGVKVKNMAKRSSKELKQAIRTEILKVFGDDYEPVQKASYVAIRKIGGQDNVCSIFGGKGGQSLWFKTSAYECLATPVESEDVSTLGRGYQHCVLIPDEFDANIGLIVNAVKASIA